MGCKKEAACQRILFVDKLLSFHCECPVFLLECPGFALNIRFFFQNIRIFALNVRFFILNIRVLMINEPSADNPLVTILTFLQQAVFLPTLPL